MKTLSTSVGVFGRPLDDGSAPRQVPSFFLQRDLSDRALREPVAPVFDAAELDGARQAGFAEGRMAGLTEAAASRATAEAAALGEIALRMEVARAAAAGVADQAADVLARALVAALGSVMPDLVRRSALSEAGAMLAEVLPGLSRAPDVQIEVRSGLEAGVAALVARLAPEQHERIAVAGLERMAEGEVRVRWAAGHALRQPAAIWQAVMDILEPGLGAQLAPPEAEEWRTQSHAE